MPPVKKPERKRNKTFLKEWRSFRKLSQDKVAALLELDRSTISRVENGETPYDQDLLERLALAYLCDPEDLLSIDPTAPDPPKLIIDRLRRAPADVQTRIMSVIEALLKAG